MAAVTGDLAMLTSDTLLATHPGSAAFSAEPEVIFNVIPPSAGKAFLTLLIVMCLCLGAVTMELFNHIRFDINLMRKPGWTQPAKFVSRVAYLLCRYLSVICLLLVVLFLSLKFEDCGAVPEAFNILGMILLDSVSLVFVQRTMALYGWKPKIVVPLTLYYCVVLAAAAVCVPFYGVGYRIPGTEFCAYDTRRHLTRTLVANIVYKSLSMGLDIILLLLTLHRLVDGGLKAVLEKKPQQLYSGISDRSLSSFLIRQGFHFYVLQLGTDIFFVATYFSFSEPSYQVLGTALICCIPPIAAAAAFREMGKKSSLVTAKNANVNEIMNSTNSPSGDNSGARITRPRQGSAAALSRIPAESNGVTSATGGVGVNSFVLQARSNAGTMGPQPEKTTRISWGGRRNHLTRSRNDPTDLDNNGILVTIGTVSRSEDVDQEWDGGSPRYSSDNPDPETLEMQRQWPRLAMKGTDEAAHRSSEGHSSTEKVDPEGFGFDPITVPTLARRPTGHNQNAYLGHLNGGSESAHSSPWIPQTPDSSYPPTLLSPRSFSRHATTSDAGRSNSISRSPLPTHPAVEEEDDSP
ncbi:hypothetical protein NDA16_001601 [Ustilago loliicola]|nr:hypothetical protein NDA16_001601 [Ustilago loliicola]